MKHEDATTTSAILTVFGAALGLVALTFGTYKASGHPSVTSTLVLVSGGVIASGSIIRWIRGLHSSQSETWRLAGIAGLVSLILSTVLAELSLRLATNNTDGSLSIGSIRLPPTWSEQRRKNGLAIEAASPSGTWREPVFTLDAAIGWVTGPNRASRDGLYFTSVEGVRSSKPGVSYATDSSRFKVALVGDSNAFSLEVPYADSWGFLLEKALGPGVRVLNYGVNGYGLDQVMLRYERDVADTHPDVVVVGFIQGDMIRSTAVYSFLSYPTWNIPFAKPRFVVKNGTLLRVNPRLPSPEEIVATSSVHSLPDVGLDYGYSQDDWAWRFENAPLLFRLVMAWSPRILPESVDVSSEAIEELNALILERLVEDIAQSGAAPVLVYLPHWTTDESLARRTLQRAQVGYTDMRDCLTNVPAKRRTVPSGAHYSRYGNAALARCTAPLVTAQLERLVERATK